MRKTILALIFAGALLAANVAPGLAHTLTPPQGNPNNTSGTTATVDSHACAADGADGVTCAP